MRIRRFVTLLETHGADLTRWPSRDVPSARALLAGSAEARRRLRAAAALDAALAGTVAVPDAATLQRMRAGVALRIARSPLPAPSAGALAEWLQPLWQIGCGAVVTLALCVLWLAWDGHDGRTDLLASPSAFVLAGTPF
ncbi:hypothetical protein [Rhodovastum atsumiense]|uniref:hypothetical protein n=1 Tax=Rhodovastum atsumiense TaxID=504468 RepID=UPI00139F2BE0|nr:hypothetical protein [Rhodovastum atsumiense]